MDTTTQTGLHADLLVIGFGKGGSLVAAHMGRLGRRVVLVEESAHMYGGTCPNIGCVPTKALVHHAQGRRPGDPPQEWYEGAVGEVQALSAKFRAGNFASMNGADTVTVVTGHAVFAGPHTVDIDLSGELADAGDVADMVVGDSLRVTADTILINTGARPIVPDIPGLRDSKRTVISTELIQTTTLPERLAIVGAGYLGIEFASIYRRFGSRVTLFERTRRILGHEDDDAVAAAIAILEDEGVEIITGAQIKEVRDGENEATIVYEKDGDEHTVDADTILAASGRAPVIQDLGLEAAGVRTTPRGAVEVDEHLRTSQPHIYALGDVRGGPQHTYLSLDDGRIVLDQLAGDGSRSTADRVAIPRTLFITPPLAAVGLTEKEAREAGHRVKIAMQAVADITAMPRSYIVEDTRGLMKFVIDAESDQILGATLLSIDAQELVNTVALAIRHGVTAAELRDAVYTHPTSTEAFNGVLGVIVRSDGE
ncbi:FAD-dependent oxidoreductase [Microbispora sp. RL4-1S]|uniref:FAD-dependent oxidoreductase n=1 Tax=Microbispora oryzae TaxID=2806554 RepID=A0A941AI87_9ACTN|nr:FAD-dependent oxidoreductase [Microbispora oryzae]MBP2704935.1 FAD-dependent oxidoreductase [Microbispora oryzae]